ncbi:beta strand repeat-containing protein [Alicyclobacillus fastidiosus]|uniref:SbsA Ig-like domain-containing protein n=1 Tax=Alicyclobacillus fastidiosus TaxID=392011 RepID=A0ABV5AFM6_9BACL|nr:hypothetical protein [Alicyclobacillus fastidiosus]WEH09575.1 hypothetical protein PYS47_23545 [Alicyclobacillus fastidiosus]
MDGTDSGNVTAYAPVFYFDQLLGKAGITAKWDGATHTWALTDSSIDASKVSVAGGVGTGNTTITLNGVVIKKINTFAAKDPGASKSAGATTYFPAYYINNVFAAVGINATWNGSTGLAVTTNPAQVAVASVTALNADQIQVVYNEPVDKTTAENVDNYTLNGTNLNSNHALAGTPATTDATAQLQADGKTVIITAGTTGGFAVAGGVYTNAALSKNTGYILNVDGVKSAVNSSTISDVNAPAFDFASDTTPATITSVTSSAKSTTTQVVVDYSEPVKATGLYYVDGQPATPSQTAANEVTLTTSQTLTAGQSYTLQVVNEADSSNNYTSTTQTFGVTSDTAAPVASVAAVNDHTVRVTFSKKIDASTIETSGAGSALKNISLLESNGTNVASSATVAPTANDTTGTEYDITYTASPSEWNSNGQLPLTVVFTNGITDVAGNTMNPSTQTVTLTKNTVVPQATNIEFANAGAKVDGSTIGANGAFVVTFNEPVQNNNVLDTQYTAVTNAGSTDSLGTLTATYDANGDKNILILSPASAPSSTASTETFYFNPGAFTDTSVAANTSASQTITANLASGVAATDTTAPTVTITGASASLVSGLNHNEFTYTVDPDVNTSTVLNTNNYRLNGAALPSGSYATIDTSNPALDTVTVHLGTGTIKTDGTYSVSVLNIADKAGNVAQTAVANENLTSDVAPTLKSATFNNDGTLTVAFSKEVTGSTGNDSDFTVKLNGQTLTAGDATNGFTVADGTGALVGDVIVTFGSGVTVNTGDTVTVGVSGSHVVDADGNVVSGTNTVSATK